MTDGNATYTRNWNLDPVVEAAGGVLQRDRLADQWVSSSCYNRPRPGFIVPFPDVPLSVPVSHSAESKR